MQTMRIAVALLAAALLCACGQKGNLYLRDQHPDAVGTADPAAAAAPATPSAGAAGATTAPDAAGADTAAAAERERENAARNRN